MGESQRSHAIRSWATCKGGGTNTPEERASKLSTGAAMCLEPRQSFSVLSRTSGLRNTSSKRDHGSTIELPKGTRLRHPRGLGAPLFGRGQVVVLVAVLVPVVLTLLAVAVDAGRLYVERSRMVRAAQAGADAGIGVVAEQMVTLAVARQTQAASDPPPIPPETATPAPPLTDIVAWLTDEDREELVSAVVQAAAVASALDYADRNGLGTEDRPALEIRVTYPQDGYFPYDAAIQTLQMRVFARDEAVILLAGLLGHEFVDLSVEAMSEIPQR